MTGIIKGWIDEVAPKVVSLVREKPELLDQVKQDPAGFVQRELGIKLPFTAEIIEKDGAYYVKPTGLAADNASEPLNDELLDLVSGGSDGNPNSKPGDPGIYARGKID